MTIHRLTNLLVMITMFFSFYFPSIANSREAETALEVSSSAKSSYFQTHRFTTTQPQTIKISENATKTEPPLTFRPKGEREFSKEKYTTLKNQDDEKNATYSTTSYPYHRFDVKVGQDVQSADLLSLTWSGHSLPGRQVTMYAWNRTQSRWMEIDRHIAGREEFTLFGNIQAENYIQDDSVHIIVQDQLPSPTKDYDYTFVWMSDTQYYAQDYPTIFKSMTEWIATNKKKLNIKYVFHTGDIVNKGENLDQWKRASGFLNTLDVAKIPYGVLPGNHDVGSHLQEYQHFFGETRFLQKPYYRGSYENNKGHYDVVSVDGKDYVFIYMGWDVEEKEMAWINAVLARYSDHTAILSFHKYLEKSGKRSQEGEKIFNHVVVPNQNVVAVLSGHYHDSEQLVDEIDDNHDGIPDRTVYQLLADYQKGPNGGNGFLRLMKVDKETNSIDVQTYSPYTNQFSFYDPIEYPSKDQFTMNIDVQASRKMVSTRSFEVKVYRELEEERVAKGTVLK
ncbi:metallophosphoesterase [Metabacillus sp. HB246100]